MTVDTLKNVLNESSDIRKEIETQKRKDLTNTFKTAPFEDLVSKAAARVSLIIYYNIPQICTTWKSNMLDLMNEL